MSLRYSAVSKRSLRNFRQREGLEGYCVCAPSISAAEIDGQIAAEATCPNCGHHGMVYRPYTLFADDTAGGSHRPGVPGCRYDSYRAFAICPACNWYIEF